MQMCIPVWINSLLFSLKRCSSKFYFCFDIHVGESSKSVHATVLSLGVQLFCILWGELVCKICNCSLSAVWVTCKHWVPWHKITDLNVEPSTRDYYPTVFFNEFWLLRDKLIPINDTVKEFPLNLEVGPISMTKWQLFLQIDQSFQIHRSYGSMIEGEADELKVLYFL